MPKICEGRVKGYRAIDEETGEVFAILVAPLQKQKIGGRWMRVFQDAQARLALDPSLRGESRRVLSYLMAVSDFQNRVPGTGVVARAMGLAQENVSRAYAQLKRAGVLIVKDGDFFLSPLLCWKGSQRQLEVAFHELVLPMKALPSP